MRDKLVVVVTGANAYVLNTDSHAMLKTLRGIGFGICHRLLIQLCNPTPPDSTAYFEPRSTISTLDEPREALHHPLGATIIMGCRDRMRASAARAKLYQLLDRHIATLKPGSDLRSYAVSFRRNVTLELEILDLNSLRTVFECAKSISQKYVVSLTDRQRSFSQVDDCYRHRYISHLICNAATTTFKSLSILSYLCDIIRHPVHAVHYPRHNAQEAGILSSNGLGYVWQCNTFGHYVLVSNDSKCISLSLC